MIKNKSKTLPISCICSIYKGTVLKELIIAIDSILIQEYKPNEIIIIVDGEINSNINSFLDYLSNFGDFFKIYYLKNNQGLGLALNYGIQESRNDLIARFDSDDINLKDRLKVQYDEIIQNPEISILGSSVLEFVNPDESQIIKKINNNFKNRFKLHMIRNPINHPSVLFKKSDIINVGLYKDIKFFEDYELWLRCIKSGLKIKNINKPLVAMKRSDFFSKRHGLKYAYFEFKFLKEITKEQTISRFLIPIYFLRIFIRIIPHRFISWIKYIDSRRNLYKKSFNLRNYIHLISTNKYSLSKKFNS